VQPSLLLDFANVKALDPRITFTRASSARFYNGVTTAKAEENLFTFSQEFDNAAWTKAAITVTANTTVAPDGTTTAETITANATTGRHDMLQNSVPPSISGVLYTASIFVKKGTHNFFQIALENQAAEFANFNLDTGTVETTGGTITTAIQALPDGSYRCSMSYTPTGTNRFPVFCLVSSNTSGRRESWTAAGTETVIFWGAQLEQRSTTTAYTPTTTQPITNYIPVLQSAADNVARFDHSPTTGESLGFLVEESRSNLLTYSEQFDDASWTKTNSTITANAIVAPDGTLTGDRFVEDTATGEHSFGKSNAFTSGTVYTQSIYVKAAGRTLVRVGAGNPATWGASVIVDLTTGAITNNTAGTASVQNAGNGWYRISITGTALATASTNVSLRLVSTGTTTSYTGDGFSGVFLWGAQLEVGSFSTSYIPTVASQVTRAADAASMTGANFSQWYRADEGAIYCDFDVLDVGTSAVNLPVYSISDATQNNMNTVFKRANADVSTRYQVRANNASVVFENLGTFTNLPTKIGTSYKTNDFIGVRNAGSAITVTAGIVPIATQLELGQLPASTSRLSGHIKKFAFYPSALTAAQLQALTS